MTRKMWGGRFSKRTDPLVEQFTSSLAVDFRLAAFDVLGSLAHARMLGACGIIPKSDAARLVGGLQQLLRQIKQGKLIPDPTAEDIHTQVESALRKRIGPVADKLHTARSRNDQVALDLRLWCRDAVQDLRRLIRALQRTLVRAASQHLDVIIPGYTHLQRAQPVLLAHHLLAYVEMLERDHQRLTESLTRINVLPLGAGALAGTTLPIDRRYVAKLLGFARVADNSLDAVADRDVVMELLAALAIMGVHLSRFAEDLILWATEEFGILELDDAFATGSSLMPQKKNPDVLELIRGQAGLAVGGLVAILTVLKGLPLAYNRDLQWDKTALFPVVDQAAAALRVAESLVQHLRINRTRAKQLISGDALCATDLAEYLVRKGVPFRQAHACVGRLILHAERLGRGLSELSVAELKRFAPQLDAAAKTVLNPRRSVEMKQSWGGTSPRHVAGAIARWRKRFAT